MHIAHFTNTYRPVVSGVVRSISSFRQALAGLGHNVFIFAQHASDYKDTEPFIFRYPSIDLPLTHHFPLAIPISPFVDKLLPSLKLEVIHSHHPFLLGQAAASKANELHIPLVFTFHTRYREYSHYVSLNQELVKEAIDRWVGDYLQKCHHIVTPSHSIEQMLAEEYGITRQVTTIPTGIDLEPYQAANRQEMRRKLGWGEEKILISIGRLAEEKNWETLLAAAAQVMQQRPEVRLVIIGGGDERRALEKQAKTLGVTGRVEFTGVIPFDEVPPYLKAADLFVFASVTETQGLVTMEAMAAGLPVVAVAASGTGDVVAAGQEGLLTDNDSQALAQAIERVIGDEALRQRLSQAARQKAKSLDSKLQAQKLVEVYQQAIADKKADRLVPVDKRKKIFSLIIDEEQIARFFGLDREHH
ncbi:MAG: glycosyltransferase family 4 protein [Chloroflexota bacterium]